MTSFEWDIRCADVELRRLHDGFTGYDHHNFGAVLFKNFAQTQIDVHVITDSLRQSGRADVTTSSKRRWEGEIVYGGFSSGIRNPVGYAVYERAKGDESHDFMRSTDYIDEELIGPVTSFFSRGRRTPHPEGGS